MNIKNYFKDWEIGNFRAVSKDKQKAVWISNGFGFFKDDYDSWRPTKPFLSWFNIFEKYIIWREFKREINKRKLKFFEN